MSYMRRRHPEPARTARVPDAVQRALHAAPQSRGTYAIMDPGSAAHHAARAARLAQHPENAARQKEGPPKRAFD